MQKEKFRVIGEKTSKQYDFARPLYETNPRELNQVLSKGTTAEALLRVAQRTEKSSLRETLWFWIKMLDEGWTIEKTTDETGLGKHDLKCNGAYSWITPTTKEVYGCVCHRTPTNAVFTVQEPTQRPVEI